MNRVVWTEYNGDEGVARWSGGTERKVQKGSEHKVNKRNVSFSDSNSVLPRLRKKNRREETVTSNTSGYNLRPRKGKREKSRLTIEKKTQQGGPVRSIKGRERNDPPYIQERTRSSNKNVRRGGDQQRQDQERRGKCTKKSLSLEVLLMFDPSSFANPTPLAHADTSRDVLPRGGTSQRYGEGDLEKWEDGLSFLGD
ncbi:hypothetical protein TNCV_1579511 [Trichonephila clavipes]|nr:hypothetical protein TNCV_1579511 [Trichonephila clavipes]